MFYDERDSQYVQELADEGLNQDTINKIALKQAIKRDIKQENIDQMERVAHLKHIEVHQKISSSIR